MATKLTTVDTSPNCLLAYVDVPILSGASLSAAVDIGRGVLAGALLPATWTAAGLSLKGSPDGTTYGKAVDGVGTEVTAASLTGGEFVSFDPNKTAGIRYLKLVSGTNGTPVNQAADRTIRLLVRRLP